MTEQVIPFLGTLIPDPCPACLYKIILSETFPGGHKRATDAVVAAIDYFITWSFLMILKID